jgi:hypothetical protein
VPDGMCAEGRRSPKRCGERSRGLNPDEGGKRDDITSACSNGSGGYTEKRSTGEEGGGGGKSSPRAADSHVTCRSQTRPVKLALFGLAAGVEAPGAWRGAQVVAGMDTRLSFVSQDRGQLIVDADGMGWDEMSCAWSRQRKTERWCPVDRQQLDGRN